MLLWYIAGVAARRLMGLLALSCLHAVVVAHHQDLAALCDVCELVCGGMYTDRIQRWLKFNVGPLLESFNSSVGLLACVVCTAYAE
mmetsp:Transcript_9249/g.16294  ORF Transcript_9249/g.16294 Transcript_9249/m.16294 type:complete len:86 (-) Transcript_9249:226-483(-)